MGARFVATAAAPLLLAACTSEGGGGSGGGDAGRGGVAGAPEPGGSGGAPGEHREVAAGRSASAGPEERAPAEARDARPRERRRCGSSRWIPWSRGFRRRRSRWRRRPRRSCSSPPPLPWPSTRRCSTRRPRSSGRGGLHRERRLLPGALVPHPARQPLRHLRGGRELRSARPALHPQRGVLRRPALHRRGLGGLRARRHLRLHRGGALSSADRSEAGIHDGRSGRGARRSLRLRRASTAGALTLAPRRRLRGRALRRRGGCIQIGGSARTGTKSPSPGRCRRGDRTRGEPPAQGLLPVFDEGACVVPPLRHGPPPRDRPLGVRGLPRAAADL